MPTADELLSKDVALQLLASVARAERDRPLSHLRGAVEAMGGLALRQRSDLLADALLADVPGGFEVLEQLVRRMLDDEAFSGWLIWPVTEAVARAAVSEGSRQSFDHALGVLSTLTPRLTAEFALRTLLNHDMDRCLAAASTWTAHSDPHVRRLATEGTRPHLPWAKKVQGILDSPESTVPLLDALYRDPSEYVRRSVGNHLNDISRQNSSLAVATAERWLRGADEHTAQVVRRGLRTLVKRGHTGALALQGFTPASSVVTDGPHLEEQSVRLGESLRFEARFTNAGTEPVALLIDYVVHHRKANGSLRPKVFKLIARTIEAGQSITVTRSHSFRRISTRTYHPGEHHLELQINGTASGRVAFCLLPE